MWPASTSLFGDKACDTDGIRAMLREMGIAVTVPGKSNRKVFIPYDQRAYKGRHPVENVFADIKEHHGIATRSCKYAHTFCGGLHLVVWHRRIRGRWQHISKYLDR